MSMSTPLSSSALMCSTGPFQAARCRADLPDGVVLGGQARVMEGRGRKGRGGDSKGREGEGRQRNGGDSYKRRREKRADLREGMKSGESRAGDND